MVSYRMVSSLMQRNYSFRNNAVVLPLWYFSSVVQCKMLEERYSEVIARSSSPGGIPASEVQSKNGSKEKKEN